MKNILIIGATPDSIINFRGKLITDLNSSGYCVSVVAADASLEQIEKINLLGATYYSYIISRNTISPILDIKTFISLMKFFYILKPDLVLAYTVKPIIWSGISLIFYKKIKFYALVEGLGSALAGQVQGSGLLRRIVLALYKIAFFRATKAIFLNCDNAKYFTDNKVICKSKVEFIDGIGLDLDWYSPSPLPPGSLVFLCIARLLIDKGLREYVNSARIVKSKYPEVIFKLVATQDSSINRIPMEEFNKWKKEGVIEIIEPHDDVRLFIELCHIYVLPSYHEGMPRTVMEAMAMGRPIITTDVPGCRHMVADGINGFLVPRANVEILADRMIWFVENRHTCSLLGEASRQISVNRFDVQKINMKIMEILCLPYAGKI